MKSVMEEGSSIGNALQKAWDRAGCPVEFSVKVFELPEKNFLGITKKPAKIAILFNEIQKTSEQKRKKEPAQKRPESYQATEKKEAQDRPLQVREPVQEKREQKFIRPSWTDEMVTATQQWLKETLTRLNYTQPFTISVNRNYLRVEFNTPIINDEARQRTLFRSFAHLIMESMRTQFKKDFRNLKVVLFVKDA